MDGKYSLLNPKTQTAADAAFAEGVQEYFRDSDGDTLSKLRDFPKFVPRQNLAAFLAKNEIFKKIIEVHGNIVECGVFMGGGLMTWAQLSAIYEPYNHNRRVVGFDTFAGFPNISDEDASDSALSVARVGGHAADGIEKDLRRAASLYDLNRPLGHIERIELIKGDAQETIPRYIEDNRHAVIALLYLDFDLFEPTLAAIKNFMPRMPKGAVLAFDELNQKYWPGETAAVMDAAGIRNLAIKRFPFTPHISYAVLD